MTVSDGCVIKFGSTGTSRSTTTVGVIGTYSFDSLTVTAGGEVTVTDDLVDSTSKLHLQVLIYVYMHGRQFSLGKQNL